jgi:hypothetical protein
MIQNWVYINVWKGTPKNRTSVIVILTCLVLTMLSYYVNTQIVIKLSLSNDLNERVFDFLTMLFFCIVGPVSLVILVIFLILLSESIRTKGQSRCTLL